MTLRKLILFTTIIFTFIFIQNSLISQEDPDNTDTPEEEEDFVEEGLQIENPVTKEDIAKALIFFNRANRSNDKDAALNDRIEGLTRLQEILTQETYRDDVIYNQSLGMYQGARAYVREIIESMDDEIIEIYKSRYEKIAETMIKNALFNKDIELLKSAIKTYPYTDSAVNGAIQGARILIEKNKLNEAVSIIIQLIKQKKVNESDKATLVSQLAFCYSQLLWDFELSELLKYSRKTLPNAKIQLGHKFHDLSSYIESMLKETKKSLQSPNYTELYAQDGGNTQNNKIVQSYVDPEDFKWTQPLQRTVLGSSHTFYELGTRYYSNNLKRIFPAVSDGTVFVPQRNNLTAYNLYSGVKKWSYSKSIDSISKWVNPVDTAITYTVTCDKQNVYAPIENSVPIYKLPSNSYMSFYGTPIVTPQRRELVCFDKHEGDVKWRVGAKWDDDLPLHEILSYPIAPTIIDDTAYVVGCIVTANAHFFLAAFDINGEVENGKPTGNAKLQWIARIATGQQEINMFGRPIREPVPEGLAYLNNKVVVCTNVGLICAFDATTGEKTWAQLYDRIPYTSTKNNNPTFRKLTWFNRPPIIFEDKVIVAPLDSNKVYCYDLNTGKLLWKYINNPYNKTSRYIIGVYNNKLFFGGTQYLFAVDLNTGKLTHALDLYEESQIMDIRASGKPVIMGNICLIPTRTAILHIDLNEVKVLKVTQNDNYSATISDLSNMGGNLVCAENTLVSVDSSNIAVAYDREGLLKLLQKYEKQFPEDLETKYRIGVLLLEDDKIDDAIEYFKKNIEIFSKKPQNKYEHIVNQSSQRLFSIYYNKALNLYYEGSYKEVNAYISLVKGYAETTEEKVQVMLLDINTCKKTDSKRVFNILDEMRSTFPEFEYNFSLGFMKAKIYASLEGALIAENLNDSIKSVDYWQTLILYNPDVRYLGKSLYKYAIKKIDTFITDNSRKVYEKWDQKANDLFESANKTSSESTYETIIYGYPNSEICEKAYYELILVLIRNDTNHDAMMIIQDFLENFSKSDKRAELMLRLYDIYNKLEVLFSARSLLKEIGEEFKGKTVQYGSQEINIDSFVKSQLELERFKNLSIRAMKPTLSNLPLKQRFRKEFDSRSYTRILPIIGVTPDKFKNQFYVMQNLGLFLCLDNKEGKELWTVNLGDSFIKSFYINNSLMIITQRGIFNIDPLNGEINWKRSYNFIVEKAAISDGIIAVSGGRNSEITGDRIFTLVFSNIDDGRIIGEYQFSEVKMIKDINFYDNTLLIMLDKQDNSYPISIMAFDIDKLTAPKYEITLNNNIKHSNILVANQKNIVVLLQRTNQLRIYDINTGEIKKLKVMNNTSWGTQRANEKIFMTGFLNREFVGYDPETFEKKWDINLDNVYSMPNFILDDERLHIFYKTRDRKYIVEEYEIITGKQIWKTEITNFTYSGSENIDMLITQKYIVAVQEKSLPPTNTNSFNRRYGSNFCIINKNSGDVKQSLEYEPLDNDDRMPNSLIINDILLVISRSMVCFGK